METLLEMWKQSIQLPDLYTFDEAQAACPPGYQVPTEEEWRVLIANTAYSFDKKNREGVFRFVDGFELRLPAAGYRLYAGDSINQGTNGYYWSSSPSGTSASSVYFNGSTTVVITTNRALAFSVRCVPLSVRLEATSPSFIANIPIALEVLEKFPHLAKMPAHELSAVIKLAAMLHECSK